MNDINNIYERVKTDLKKLDIYLFNENIEFDNPINSNCILKIKKEKIAFANINRLCKYFDFFDKYKKFKNISEEEESTKNVIDLHEINKEGYNIYIFIKIIYNFETFNINFIMKKEYIGEFVHLSDILCLKDNFKLTLYDYVIQNIDGYKYMNLEIMQDNSFNELIMYILNNCLDDINIINFINHWQNYFDNNMIILIRNKIKEKFKKYSTLKIYNIYKDCLLLNIKSNEESTIFNFIPLELLFINKNIIMDVNKRKPSGRNSIEQDHYDIIIKDKKLF